MMLAPSDTRARPLTLADAATDLELYGVATCSFPMGASPPEGQMQDQLFCAKVARDGSSYRPDHHKACHRPGKPISLPKGLL